MVKLFLAVIASGAASLLYQVAWTRRLASVTSATVVAQTVVLAVFMLGLGLGALLAGRLAPRIRRPLLAYAVVEAGALIVAVISMPVIESSEAVRTLLAGAGIALSTGLWIQLFAVALFLLVPTALLGASLPFVIEYGERLRNRTLSRGATVSLLYGFNTFGAVLGCLAGGFWSIESFGLTATTRLGAGLALVAVAIASWAGWRPSSTTEGRRVEAPPLPAGLLVASGLAGAIGLGAEVVWTRLFMLIVNNTVYAFTQVLAAVLVGIALGGYAAALLGRRRTVSDPSRHAILDRAGFAISLAAVALAAFPLLIVALAGDVDLAREFGTLSAPASALFLLLGPVVAAALVAMTLPLLVTHARETRSASAFGTLYAVNTVGSVAGSLLAGFLLVPRLGTQAANATLAVATLALAVLLFSLAGSLRRRVFGLAATAVVCGIVQLSYELPRGAYEALLASRFPRHPPRILQIEEGIESDVMVTEDRRRKRLLWINSKWVAGAGGGHSSGHQALGHLSSLFVRDPRRAAGIALGTGQTFSAVLDHGFERFHCVEINASVIDLSRRWFGAANRGLLDDPRVVVHNDDGRAFLRATDERFELIVLEPLQAWTAGTSNLYAREFYEDAKRVLVPGGVVGQWIPFYGQGTQETKTMVATALDAFAHGSLWVEGMDGFLLVSDRELELDPDVVSARIRERGLGPLLAETGANTTADVLSYLALGTEGVERWAGGSEILTDDHPFLEFRAAREIAQDPYPEILRGLVENLGALPREAEAIRAAVLEDQLLELPGAGPRFEERAGLLERALEALPTSGRVRARYRRLVILWSQQHPDDAALRAEILARAAGHDAGFPR